MNSVKLISVPNVDYVSLREVSRKTLNLDTPALKDDVRSALALLEKWGGLVSSHFSFSFIFCSTHFHLIESANHSGLQHILIERTDGFWLAYVSGSLDAWKNAIVHCTARDCSTALRTLYSRVYSELRDYLPTTIRSEIRLIR